MVFIQPCDRRAKMSPSFVSHKKKLMFSNFHAYDLLKQGFAQTRASKLEVTSG